MGTCQCLSHSRQELPGDVPVHDEFLRGIAYTHALRLRIDHDVDRLVDVGRGIDVDMHIPSPGLNHRNARLMHHGLNETGSTPRDEHIDMTGGSHHRTRTFPAIAVDRCHKCRIEMQFLQHLVYHL